MLVEIQNLFKAEFAKTTMKAHTGDVIYKIYTAFFCEEGLKPTH